MFPTYVVCFFEATKHKRFQVFHMWFLFYGRSGQYNVSINYEPFYFFDEATQKTPSEVKDAISAYGKANNKIDDASK